MTPILQKSGIPTPKTHFGSKSGWVLLFIGMFRICTWPRISMVLIWSPRQPARGRRPSALRAKAQVLAEQLYSESPISMFFSVWKKLKV